MFFSRSKSKLGIDVGTTSIKLVQLKKEQQKFVLETYGAVNVSSQFTKREGFDVIKETAAVIKELAEQSKVSANRVVASLPNSIVFVTMIEMPKMSEKELKSAIEFEARRYIPLPLEEVTTSWSVLEDGDSKQQKLKVLLTAVPTTVIDNYLKMLKMAGLKPDALEIEALALTRSLVGDKKESYLIIDIGGRNTSLNLVEQGFLRVSRNIVVGGETITNGIAQNLKVSVDRAEQFKRELGLKEGMSQQIPQAMRPAIDRIKSEASQLLKIYESSGNSVKQIIFSGSAAKIPGLPEYFTDLGAETTLGNPLRFISYDARLKQSLEEKKLGLSVAVGLAMRDEEQ